jgi:hypothetical protein
VDGVVDLTKEELIVYVELRAQYLPLVNVTVTAILEDPSINTKTEVELLRDDGKGFIYLHFILIYFPSFLFIYIYYFIYF